MYFSVDKENRVDLCSDEKVGKSLCSSVVEKMSSENIRII